MDLPQKMEKKHGFARKNGEKQWIYQKKLTTSLANLGL